MTYHQTSRGFGAVEAIIVVVIVFIVGALGVVGYRQLTKSGAADSVAKTAENEIAAPATVESISDLDTSLKAVNDATTDGDTVDVGQLDSQAADL